MKSIERHVQDIKDRVKARMTRPLTIQEIAAQEKRDRKNALRVQTRS